MSVRDLPIGLFGAVMGLVGLGLSARATATVVLIPGQGTGALSTELIVLAVALATVILFIQRDAANQQVDPGRPVAPRGSVAIRRALGLGGTVGLGALVAACTRSSPSGDPAPSLSASSTAPSDVLTLLDQANTCVTAREETQGPYWFDVYLNEELVTRMPLRVIYQQLQAIGR